VLARLASEYLQDRQGKRQAEKKASKRGTPIAMVWNKGPASGTIDLSLKGKQRNRAEHEWGRGGEGAI